MRIRSIEVRNWACIEELRLTNLQDGIVLLHGPNRTGKSSLVQAIRSCLFDHQHDSQDSIILGAIPWRSKQTPSVVIEFDHVGVRYKISKTFAKSRFGDTWLEQQTAGVWTTLDRGKTAAKKVRDLLGVQSSGAGVFQMLWLNQQDFRLPAQDKLDSSLKKSLETVLGSLITGTDVDFKERLDRACEHWFTGTMKDRKESPVSRLKADVDQARATRDAVERQYHEAEAALRQLDEALKRQPELKRDLQQAEDDLARMQADLQALEVRKARHDLAVRSRDQARKLFEQAEAQQREWTADAERLKGAMASLDANQQAIDAAERDVARAREGVEQAKARLELADATLEQHWQQRGALDDRQQLLHLAQRAALLAQAVADRETHARKLAELEPLLAGPAVLTEYEIEELRRQRDEAVKLRAQLEAAEIHVTLLPQKPVSAHATIDGKPGKEVAVAAGKEQRWHVRQQAELTLGDVAIRVGRAREDRALEELARRCAELERECQERLDVAQASSIDALVGRRLEREAVQKEAHQHRDALARMAPANLETEPATLAAQRQAILARRPDLAAWMPNLQELERLRHDFNARETSLHAEALSAKQALAVAEMALAQAELRQRSLNAGIVEQSIAVRTLTEKLAQHDAAALTAAVAEAAGQLRGAQALLDASALSDADHAVAARCHEAVQVQRQRAIRSRENEDALLRLQTQLAGTEGLHQMRVQAEQTLADLERHFARESLQASAHRHLKELFEEIHEEQLRRTALPINDRVMDWAQRLGLTDYARLRFDDDLLPGELEPLHAPAGTAIALEDESFGTLEQLSLLIRLAVGGLLARSEPTVALLDDPLAHADLGKHTRMLDILEEAARGQDGAGALQVLVFTCHPERFTSLTGAQQFDLAALIRRGG
ncbi:MAG TPA: AAA family ATPase [Gemmataceae bacterium]|nr:AAA family ATPase [Gemmataceae bacterium]